MARPNENLIGGFPNAVYDSQAVFRTVMDALAQPGSFGTCLPAISAPPPLGIAAASILLTLCDDDTPIWLSPLLAKSGLPKWVSFHTGAQMTDNKADARFVFVDKSTIMPCLSHFCAGSQEYPDRSTTLVVELAALEGGAMLQLTGPGIQTSRQIGPTGLPPTFLRQWSDNHALFPRGVDLILTCGSQLLALPRSCKITPMES